MKRFRMNKCIIGRNSMRLHCQRKKNLELLKRYYMKYITDEDYNSAKRFCKTFKMKDFGEYHDLYV